MTVKHISLDVWGTLIHANPKYTKHRNEFLGLCFNQDPNQIAMAYATVKRDLDSNIEALPAIENFGHLIKRFNHYFHTHLHKDFDRIIQESLETYFFMFPPIVNHEAKKELDRLRRVGVTTSILSNSNFISGRVMRGFITGAYGAFNFQFYSDLIGAAKPSPVLYQALIDGAKKEYGISPQDILHIGDDYINDIKGPAEFGIQTGMLTDEVSILDILKAI